MDYSLKLRALEQANLRRKVHCFESPQEAHCVVDGRPMLLFASNSYLGLAHDATIKKRVCAALEKYGHAAGGSRLTTGTCRLHTELEHVLAKFKGTESALLFNCGYMANVGTLSALTDAHSVIFSDALNHASIIDGCRMSRASCVVYAHTDMDDLRAKIRHIRPETGIVVTDSVFSMDGDIAPLPSLVQICREHGLRLMVDDAHATGVLGATGRGSAEHFGLEHDAVDIIMGTLSKALASEGGFIAGKQELCEYLQNTARPFIYSTALSPATIAAALGGIEHLCQQPETLAMLQNNVRYFTEQCHAHGLGNMIRGKGETPIIPIIIGDEGQAHKVSQQLFDRGLFVPCIRYPTVKKGEARLRFTLMASHTHEDMDYAVHALKDILL